MRSTRRTSGRDGEVPCRRLAGGCGCGAVHVARHPEAVGVLNGAASGGPEPVLSGRAKSMWCRRGLGAPVARCTASGRSHPSVDREAVREVCVCGGGTIWGGAVVTPKRVGALSGGSSVRQLCGGYMDRIIFVGSPHCCCRPLILG